MSNSKKTLGGIEHWKIVIEADGKQCISGYYDNATGIYFPIRSLDLPSHTVTSTNGDMFSIGRPAKGEYLACPYTLDNMCFGSQGSRGLERFCSLFECAYATDNPTTE